MSSKTKDSVPHEVRTAAEPRQNRLYNVRLSHIEQVTASVRLLQLTIPPHVQSLEAQNRESGDPNHPQPLTFLPGQWLDVHIPSISNAGGFSITSTPADAQVLPSPEPPTVGGSVEETGLPPLDPRGRAPYIELAVQYAPSNPASAWLWKNEEDILGKELSIRVGGSFVWPPSKVEPASIKNIVLIAGGVGINPLISILSHLNNNNETTNTLYHPSHIHILYSTRLPNTNNAPGASSESALDRILFVPRLRQIIQCQSQSHRLQISLDLFITNLPDNSHLPTASPSELKIHSKRIAQDDIQKAIAGADNTLQPDETVCYLCGPPKMTDEMVGGLRELLGEDRVFFEKWW
ncbi:hypothetical protein AWENTII_004781 [Aspergillus wentii]